MALASSDLYRAFTLTNTIAACSICAAPLADDDTAARLGFYLTGKRSVIDGIADMVPSHQVAPKNAMTLARGAGCTCRGRRAHTKRCTLYKACECPSRTSKRGKRYVAHKKACVNSLKWETLPGYWDVCVHADCASSAGFVTPANVKVTRGNRAQGLFGGAVDLSPEDRAAMQARAEAWKAAREIANVEREAAIGARDAARKAAQDAADTLERLETERAAEWDSLTDQEKRFRLLILEDDAPEATEAPEDDSPPIPLQID